MDIGALILGGYVSPASLVDGTMTLLDLNYVANLVKYKEAVHTEFAKLKVQEIERQRSAGGNYGGRK